MRLTGSSEETPAAAPSGGPAGAPSRRPRSIREQLSRLVLAAMLPAFLFSTLAAWSAYEGRRRAAERDLMQTARAVSAAFDAEFARRQAVLEALAASPALQSGDLKAFYAEARGAAQGDAIALHDAKTGAQILNTSLPLGAPTPKYADAAAWIGDAVTTGRPQVKNVRWSRVMQTWTTVVQVPVTVDGRVRWVIHSDIPSSELMRMLRKFQLPSDWLVAVIDRTGVRAVRSQDNDRKVGQATMPALRSLVLSGREGFVSTPSSEGVPMLNAVARSPVTGYSAAIGVPARAFAAAFWASAALLFLGGVAASALGLGLAALMARRITRPLAEAAEAARSLGRGAPVVLPPARIEEIDVISHTLTEASGVLAERSAARDREAAELEDRVHARTRELDEANRALASNEARLRAIFDSTFQLTGLATIDGRAVAVNRAALQAVGASEKDVIGRPMWETPWWAGNPLERDRMIKALARVRAGEFVRYEGTANLPGGTRTFDFSMRPLYLEGGEAPDHVLAEGRDLTELKAAQEQAERSQKMEALGLLTGGVAHDFNNILTVIKGAIEVALKAPGEPRAERLLRAALEASQRGEELNKQLLGFARRRPVTQVRVNCTEAIDRLAPLLRNAVGGARKLELELDRVEGVCVVEPAQFETALLNLVVNARDATPEGGAVSVRVRPPGAADREHFAPMGDDIICVEVADTGQGIAPEHLSRIFDPFFTTKPPGRGTGLGLSQVYGFVRQSGGQIDVASEAGRGTRVTIALPLDRSAAAEPAPAPRDRVAGRSLKVLLVEDDPLVVDVSETMLRTMGHAVETAGAAAEALAKLEAGEFDLLFTDVIMPEGVNGVQLARQAKARRPRMKVLLCSGWTADALSDSELSNAPWPLLHKPFSSEDLERAIAEAMAEPGRAGAESGAA